MLFSYYTTHVLVLNDQYGILKYFYLLLEATASGVTKKRSSSESEGEQEFYIPGIILFNIYND